MLTYEEIISQVAQSLGHSGFSGELKANYRYAVRWAETELLSRTDNVRYHKEIPLHPGENYYDIPPDYSSIKDILIYDELMSRIAYVETTWQRFMDYDPQNPLILKNDIIMPAGNNPQSVMDNAIYVDKVVIAIHRAPGKYQVGIKPSIAGTLQLYYTVVPVDDVFASLKKTPMLAGEFHHFIIHGAVKYLAGLEAAKAVAEKDYDKARFFQSLSATAEREFTQKKLDVQSKTETRSKPVQAKADPWYEDLRKYR